MKGWLLVGICWAAVSAAHLQTTQGTYEDHVQMAGFDSVIAPAPTILRPRGLTRWTLWAQGRSGTSPAGMRLSNLVLMTLVAGMTGVVAFQLGWTPWVATGALLLHPLATETMATLSGRAELLAALGVVLACSVVLWRPWLGTLVACLALGLGVLGKETAALGLVLVPWTVWAFRPRRGARLACLVGATVVALGVVLYQHIGSTSLIHVSAWEWLRLQAGASFRVLTIAVLPLGQTVDADVDGFLWIYTVGALLTLGSLVWLIGPLWQTHRWIAWMVGWVLLTILPRLVLQTPKSYFNEHQFTLALVGLALGLSAVVSRPQVLPCS